MRTIPTILAALALVPLSACASVPTNLTTQTPVQVSDFGAAEHAAAAVANVADAYVVSGKSTVAWRANIKAAADVVEADAKALRTARDAGQPLVFDTINAALKNLTAAQKPVAASSQGVTP